MAGSRAEHHRTHDEVELFSAWLPLQPIEVALILGVTLVAHIATNHVAFRLRIRDAKR